MRNVQYTRFDNWRGRVRGNDRNRTCRLGSGPTTHREERRNADWKSARVFFRNAGNSFEPGGEPETLRPPADICGAPGGCAPPGRR